MYFLFTIHSALEELEYNLFHKKKMVLEVPWTSKLYETCAPGVSRLLLHWLIVFFHSWLYKRIHFILKLDTQECTSTGTRSSGQHEAHPSELTDSRSHSTAYLYNRFTVRLESSRDQFIASFAQPLLLNLLLESMFSSAASRSWWSFKVWVLAPVIKKPRGIFNMSTQWIKPHTSSTYGHRESKDSAYNTCIPCCLT